MASTLHPVDDNAGIDGTVFVEEKTRMTLDLHRLEARSTLAPPCLPIGYVLTSWSLENEGSNTDTWLRIGL